MIDKFYVIVELSLVKDGKITSRNLGVAGGLSMAF